MDAVHAPAETLEATLDHMNVVEDMRRTLREIRDLNPLDSNEKWGDLMVSRNRSR
jgi:hypothetical protein